jgi:hypothetical protein
MRGQTVRATPQARALAGFVDFLDRFWGLVAVAVAVLLEALVLAPREMHAVMIVTAVVAAVLAGVWVRDGWL